MSLAALLLAIASFASMPLHAAELTLGETTFPNSGNEAAQEPFLRGLLLLHSFEYHDARKAFQDAQTADPGFAMAYWGEAMTHNHPIWLQENVDKAREVLNRLAPTAEERAAKAPTEREKAYLASLEILFGEGDKRQRDHAYAEALRQMRDAYPDDLDAASFYALALLGTCHDGRDTAVYMQAAAVVEEVFDRNPLHPGAAHYLIHSYDDPVHAPLGIRPAKIYAEIAPAAAHALHMPSHIFLALGWWNETAASNEDSWQAGEDKVKAEDLPLDRRNYHALLWLEYAYLQQGRYEEARKLLKIMQDDTASSDSTRAHRHLAYMRAHYLTETEAWASVPERPNADRLNLDPFAADHFAAGFTAIQTGRLDDAYAIYEAMRARREKEIADDNSREGYSSGYTRVGTLQTAAAEAMELQVLGMVQLVRGQEQDGLATLVRATEVEADAPFGYGPPVPVKPSNELLGEVYTTLGRYDEAKAQFESSLARAPRRTRSLLGLARAAGKLGDTATVERAHSTLREVLAGADSGLRELGEIGVVAAGR